MKIEIRSRRNPRVQEARKLKRREYRTVARRFLLEGIRSIEEALDAGASIHEVLVSPHLVRCDRGSALYERLLAEGRAVTGVAEEVLACIADTETPQGIVAIVEMPDEPLSLAGTPLVLAGDSVSDPGNLGTLIRSAAAFGLTGIVVSGNTVDPFNPKCVRATMGGIFHVPLQAFAAARDAIFYLKESGLSVVAGDVRAKTLCYDWDFTGRCAILVGGEAEGITPTVLELCDASVRIPMPGGRESLNVAVAGSVLVYEAARQRGLLRPDKAL